MKYLFIASLLTMLAGCKKSGDASPSTTPSDDAGKVAGRYTINRIVAPGLDTRLPYSTPTDGTTSGVLTATKLTPSILSVQAVLTTTKLGELAGIPESYTIVGVDLIQSNAKVGTADGTNFIIDVTKNGERTVVIANR